MWRRSRTRWIEGFFFNEPRLGVCLQQGGGLRRVTFDLERGRTLLNAKRWRWQDEHQQEHRMPVAVKPNSDGNNMYTSWWHCYKVGERKLNVLMHSIVSQEVNIVWQRPAPGKWKITKTRFPRSILNIFWPNVIWNIKLHIRTTTKYITQVEKMRKWNWIGNVFGMLSTSLPGLLSEGGRGRPNVT